MPGAPLKDYQRQRLATFIDPEKDPLGSGYTVLQAVSSLGSGGLWGRGLGQGPQSRLNYLPESRTDFVFARIGEELGLVGVAVLLALYAILFWRVLLIAMRATDIFAKTAAAGIFAAFVSGFLVNAGMNVGLLPITGVPLPFVSYGGSSLVTMFLLVGLAESIAVHGETWASDESDAVVMRG